ncbi:MAG: NAD(P)-binding protein [Syntrophomonadaceae bacterium]|nr:NAD(P)-binding protein [Syntrophomonadaceae bacterium]
MARALVVGGGPSGLESSWHLAEKGLEVILIENDEKLGGRPRWYTCKAVDQCRKCGACLVSE